jgi:uncharacterized tellurite resistance protein B-like protein
MSIETSETLRMEILLPGLTKLEFSAGSQGALIWVEDLERRVGNIRNSQSKMELLQIIRTGEHHEIEWRNETQVREEFPGLEESQITAILEASHKISARELVQQQECRTAVNAFLYSAMGKSSLENLLNDEIYNQNDLNAKDPVVAWARIMATHVTARDGSGTQRQHTALNTMVAEFASIKQNSENESITEYMRRYERAEKTLLNAGFNVKSQWLDSEEKRVVKFLYSLDQAKFGRLIRDVANMVVPIPASIQELIKTAKERKEVVTTTQRTSVLATSSIIDDSQRAVLMSEKEEKRDPLSPYPRYSAEEWGKFSASEKSKIVKHNAAIRKASAAMTPPAEKSKTVEADNQTTMQSIQGYDLGNRKREPIQH